MRSEGEFQNLARRLALALDASQIGVWEHDLESGVLDWDGQMHRLYATGRGEGPVEAALWDQRLHPQDRARAYADFESAVTRQGPYRSQFRIVLPDGEIRHLRSYAHFCRSEGGAAYFIGAEWDVTADVLLAEELQRQKAVAEARTSEVEEGRARVEEAANHDYLTGMANRRLLDQHLATLPAGCRMGVIHVDLDGFKQINDSEGQAAGDKLLQAAAGRIRDLLPERGFAARLGGDEFLLLLPETENEAALSCFAEGLHGLLQEPVALGEISLQTSVSLGLALTGDDPVSAAVAHADLALRAAKEAGRGRIVAFSPALLEARLARRQTMEELRLGMARGEFLPFYQIQLEASSRRIVGLEALVRWRHPLRGIVSPAEFLPIATECGLAGALDAAMLEAVLADIAAWKAAGLTPPRVSVNISPQRLADPSLPSRIRALQIPPNTIAFELLETIFLDDLDSGLTRHLAEFREMGIDIEIDDFGSGHASLIGLMRLRPKGMKLDRHLVKDIVESSDAARVVASIIGIAHMLGVEVIAEGVETEAHAERLSALGCDKLQGYGLGRPASAEDTARRLMAEGRVGRRLEREGRRPPAGKALPAHS